MRSVHALIFSALAIFAIAALISSASGGSWPMLHIMTRTGVPNPHVRSDSRHPWNDCWGCHAERHIPTAQTADPPEPCASCHLPASAADKRWTAQCDAPICPVLLNYLQSDGSQLSFFFGNKRR